jgi:hypothetical protein
MPKHRIQIKVGFNLVNPSVLTTIFEPMTSEIIAMIKYKYPTYIKYSPNKKLTPS